MLKPVGILQMAIKMHEACWNRGEEPLKQEKQNLREKKKKSGGVCAAKLILQGLRRELQMRAAPPRLLVCTSKN